MEIIRQKLTAKLLSSNGSSDSKKNQNNKYIKKFFTFEKNPLKGTIFWKYFVSLPYQFELY